MAKTKPPVTAPQIRDRIKELRRVPAAELVVDERNPWIHSPEQQEGLRAVLRSIGYASALVAREREDGRLVLIDGHLRKETTPGAVVPVLVLDVTADEADVLLATLNPLAAMVKNDTERLDALLAQVKTDDPATQQLLDELASQGEPVKLQAVDVAPPPRMTWVLIAIPTVRFGEIAATVEQLAQVEGIFLESSVSDHDQVDQENR